MTTLITAANNDATLDRCDSKCYNALLPKCDCICGGKNHGVGLTKAIDNTREMGQDLADRTAATVSLPLF